ncbi:MAG: hypothetical protein WC758_01625 [Candidatus Woesearchaeota archaeon]|jgi:hypothetical protein
MDMQQTKKLNEIIDTYMSIKNSRSTVKKIGLIGLLDGCTKFDAELVAFKDGLTTIENSEAINYISEYMKKEQDKLTTGNFLQSVLNVGKIYSLSELCYLKSYFEKKLSTSQIIF